MAPNAPNHRWPKSKKLFVIRQKALWRKRKKVENRRAIPIQRNGQGSCPKPKEVSTSNWIRSWWPSKGNRGENFSFTSSYTGQWPDGQLLGDPVWILAGPLVERAAERTDRSLRLQTGRNDRLGGGWVTPSGFWIWPLLESGWENPPLTAAANCHKWPAGRLLDDPVGILAGPLLVITAQRNRYLISTITGELRREPTAHRGCRPARLTVWAVAGWPRRDFGLLPSANLASVTLSDQGNRSFDQLYAYRGGARSPDSRRRSSRSDRSARSVPIEGLSGGRGEPRRNLENRVRILVQAAPYNYYFYKTNFTLIGVWVLFA